MINTGICFIVYPEYDVKLQQMFHLQIHENVATKIKINSIISGQVPLSYVLTPFTYTGEINVCLQQNLP